MGKKLFGTDGIRGVSGEYPLDDKTVYAAGLALAELVRDPTSDAQVLIGMDTRESSLPLARRIAAGLQEAGVETRCAGVIPTSGVAYLTADGRFAAGVMISASHNSFEDNGIKVFSPSGYKLPDSQEHEVEVKIFERLSHDLDPGSASIHTESELADQYLYHLLSVGEVARSAKKTRAVVDCANGAASDLGPRLFDGLKIKAKIIGNHPNGRNINLDCGSLHLEPLQQKVVRSRAQLGVAFDGDADRALFVAEDGSIVDGDAVLLMAADHLARENRLAQNLVVTTVMANMGLEKALQERGIRMARTPVGDKYVLEEMLRSGAVLGGEQSGHIIFREFATTGDGLLTARMLLEILASSGKPLSELRNQLKVFPQQLKNLRVTKKVPFEEVPALGQAIAESESELGGQGRVLVRYSGTEPLVRIMVEAEGQTLVERHIARLADVFQEQLGA